MKKKRTRDLSMPLLFSLFVCLVFLITSFIIASVSFWAIQSGFILMLGDKAHFALILIVLFSSVFVGTMVSLVMGRFPLKLVHQLIRMTKELAGGNFGVRLRIDRPPVLRDLAESFNSMARELGGLEMLRKDFVNNFSHEFKTPIVSIKGFAEMLKYGDLSEEEKNEYLDIVISESARLAELSSNVLYLSKIENQEILSEKDPFQLGEQIRHCILLLRPKWEAKRIALSIELTDILFLGNEEMLGHVWRNLLDNAIKFTPEGGAIRIALKADRDRVRFEIRDSGGGIGQDALPHIYDRFYQADTSHAAPGSGLGLTLVKKIVSLHRGAVECRSVPGQGAAFAVTLPLHP